MSDTPNNGGPAFPGLWDEHRVDGSRLRQKLPGMSLRDYFAGKVLEGLCANGARVQVNGEDVSHDVAAYRIADGMLKTRELPLKKEEVE